MDIKSAIEKLNNIDVNDLKNLDLAQIKSNFSANPHLFINGIIIVVTLIACFSIFNMNRSAAKNLRNQIPSLEEQLEAVNKNKQLQLELNKYFSELPETLEESQVVEKVSELAFLNDVQILSYSPAQEIKDDYSRLLNVNMKIASESYENIYTFVKAIEDANYTLRLNSWIGEMDSNRQSSRSIRRRAETGPENPIISAQIEIGSVVLIK